MGLLADYKIHEEAESSSFHSIKYSMPSLPGRALLPMLLLTSLLMLASTVFPASWVPSDRGCGKKNGDELLSLALAGSMLSPKFISVNYT